MPLTVVDRGLRFGSLAPLSPSSVDCLVVHTQGAPGNADGSAAAIHEYHRLSRERGGRGWAGIGYHFVIRKTGQVERGRPLDRQGAHVQGHNHASIGICCSGNGDLADFTAEQKRSLADLVRDLRGEFPGTRVEGHRQLVDHLVGSGRLATRFRTTKTCPGTRVSLYELQQLCGLDLHTPRSGDRRWSRYLGDWVILTRYESDTEWYFARGSRPNGGETRAQARWSEMPLAPG